MSRLESARARLEGAINRLEEVLRAGQAAAGDDPAAMQRQLAAMRADANGRLLGSGGLAGGPQRARGKS